MYESRSFPLVLLVAINFLLNSPANAGVVKRSIRMVREVYPPDVEPENDGIQPQVCIVGDVVYGADEAVPAEQPCLKCRCQPPGVQCETVQCAKKPGCKAIHRSNKCCPDYQCECEHNGKIYANGEKLETNPGGECKVCYCRGGELQCAEVSCYIRKDCEGKRVPGTCCPKYDHCPPIDALPDRTYLTTETPLNTLKPVVLELWQESTNSTDTPSIPTLNNIPEDSNKVPDTSYLATASPSFQEIPQKDEGMLPRITIQEIIPERKEIPITAPPKIYISEPQGTLVIEEALPTNENTSNDLSIDDSEPDSSEISEVFQHPPPILRVGDKLIYLKKGQQQVPEKNASNPQSVITIIGAEGLQRGGVEESLEVHEVKIAPENDVQADKNDDSVNGDNDVDSGLTNINLDTKNEAEGEKEVPQVEAEPQNNEQPDDSQANGSETNDLELKTAESTHILSLVKKKKKSVVSTTTSTTPEPTTSKEEALTTLTSSIEEPSPSESSKLLTDSLASVETTISPTSDQAKDPESNVDTPTTILPLPEPTTEPQVKHTESISEQNPAYPPLPDVMPAVGDVSQKFEIELENENSTTMEIKILPEVYQFIGNKTKNETHSEWLKVSSDQKNNESLINFKAATLPDELLNQKSPIDEEEDSTTEVEELTTLGYEPVNATENKNKTLSKESVENSDNLEKMDSATENQRFELPENDQTQTQHPERHVKKDKFIEEGAQLIAEVKLSEDLSEFDQTTTASVTTTSNSDKVMADILESSKEANTETVNTKFRESDHIESALEYLENLNKEKDMLKLDTTTASIPMKMSEEKAEINKTAAKNNTEIKKETISPPKISLVEPLSPKLAVELIQNNSSSKSTESLEEDSGEQTTPKSNHSAMVSNENASVERLSKDGNLETNDMVSAAKEVSVELGSVELEEASTRSVLADVEMIVTSAKSIEAVSNQSSTENIAKQAVELINVMNIPKPTKAKIESSTYELLPTPEEAKSIIKREVGSESSHEDIFKDLEKELNAESSFITKNPTEEQSEADQIFKELMEETKGTQVKNKPKSKEQETVDSLSNALAGIALKGQAPDVKVLRLIGGLFRGNRK